MIKLVHLIKEAFEAMTQAVEDWSDDRDVVKEWVTSLTELGQTAYVITAPFEFLFNLLKLGFDATKLMLQQLLTDFARVDNFVVGLLAKIGVVSQETAQGFQAAADVYSSALTDMENKTVATSEKLFDFNVSTKIQDFNAKLAEFIAGIKQPTEDAFAGVSAAAKAGMTGPMLDGWSFMVNGFNAAFGKVNAASEDFRRNLQGRLTGAFTAFKEGFAHSFASIGDALVKGKNAFAAFGQALLGVFGDLAIQIGTFYFLLGLANLFFNPAAAAAEIAGGLALIVLGGALKALGSGGGGGGAPSADAGGGGGVAANAGVGTAPATDQGQAPTQARGEVGTHVQVIVQGNVLDRRQTGLELADAINDAFGSNGVKFATG